jgi:Abnormal spindle-like microcephaly-assoc'd, ASPM-SPD-2-Hydin
MTRALARIAVLLVATAGGAFAQFPFQLLIVNQMGQAAAITNDANIGFNAEVGQSVTYHLTATYLPANTSNTVTVSQAPAVLGSIQQFTITNFPMLPVMLSAGSTLKFDITFKSTSVSQAQAQLTMNFTETSQGTTGPVTTPNALVLLLTGTSPSFNLGYELTSVGNFVSIPSGGAIMFPATQVNTSAVALLDISNVGSGQGSIQNITTPTDPAFKVTGIGPLPITVNSGQALQLTVIYTPTASTTDNDQITITLASGTVLTVLLQGSGINAAFTYQIISGSTPTPVTPPGPIALPDTNVGSTSNVTVRVQNTGNAKGIINSAPSVSGAGFTVTQTTLFPDTLNPNDSFTFTINFAPTTPGAQKGTLIVGSDLFNLTGNALGSQLTFSYMLPGGASTSVASGGTVVFSPVQVTQTEQATFVITNSGTQTANISNIGIGEANSPFSVSGVQFPISLSAGQSTQFTLSFSPTTAGGFVQGTLRIDTNVITLSGSGTQPPPLPSYSFTGPSGNVSPQTQPTVGLTLSSGYPVAVSGTLTLTTNSSTIGDPAVRFINGLTTAPFTIAANNTTANFTGQGSQIALQTGTVAENIVLTPSFQTQVGGIDLTPSPVTTLTLTVPTAAPTLLAVATANSTSTGFTLNVTGFSTTRSLTTMTVQFTAAAGFNFGTNSQVQIDVASAATSYFATTGSQSFGGQFEVSVPFTFTGTNLPSGTTPIQAIKSVSVTVANSVGTSSALQVNLQ